MPPVFNEEKCIRCGKCVKDCPAYILALDKKQRQKPRHVIERIQNLNAGIAAIAGSAVPQTLSVLNFRFIHWCKIRKPFPFGNGLFEKLLCEF